MHTEYDSELTFTPDAAIFVRHLKRAIRVRELCDIISISLSAIEAHFNDLSPLEFISEEIAFHGQDYSKHFERFYENVFDIKSEMNVLEDNMRLFLSANSYFREKADAEKV